MTWLYRSSAPSSSRPARGAWIEIDKPLHIPFQIRGRAPHGARGLKFPLVPQQVLPGLSRPARGAWIEISRTLPYVSAPLVAPRTGRVD